MTLKVGLHGDLGKPIATHREKHFRGGHIPEHAQFKDIVQNE